MTTFLAPAALLLNLSALWGPIADVAASGPHFSPLSPCEPVASVCAVADGVRQLGTPTPPTNRGVVIHIDYLSVTVHGLESARLAGVYHRFLSGVEGAIAPIGLGDFFSPTQFGGRGYEKLHFGDDGSTVYTHPRDKGGHIHVELKGTTSSRYSGAELLAFVSALNAEAEKVKVTRIDFAIDHSDIGPEYFKNAEAEDRIVSRSRSFYYQHSHSGDTFYIGKRSSERSLCVYNSHGFNRVEFRLRQGAAQSAVEKLQCLGVDSMPALTLGWLRDLCRVTEKKRDKKNPDRNIPCPQWREFVASASDISLDIPTRSMEPNMERLRAYVQRVMPKVKLYHMLTGVDPEFLINSASLSDKDYDLGDKINREQMEKHRGKKA